MIDSDKIIQNLQKKLSSYGEDSKTQNVGSVIRYADGVAVVSGLSKVAMGEKVLFKDGSTGMVLNLDEDTVSVILLDEGQKIKEGSDVKTTGEMLGIDVSDAILGRVINPLGVPLDEKQKIKKDKAMPLEKIAPGVVMREPVNTPLKTGIKAIDSMIPIGRGQRELIIGDRQTGKTAIAIDTIINQKQKNKSQKQVICIYVAIGQKRSTITQIVDKLSSSQALQYSIIISASASDPASLQ